MSPKQKAENTSAGIWRSALIMTPVMWGILLLISGFMSHLPLQAAVVVTGVRALLGLAVWCVYHVISRRNDGLAFFIATSGGLVPDGPHPTLEGELKKTFILMGAQLVMAMFVGYWGRQRSKERIGATGPGLWDEALDAPQNR